MNLRFLAAGSLLTMAALLACAMTSAEAAKKPRPAYPYRVVSSHGPNVSYMVGHTRIFVTKRSWLDAGTEVLPGDRHYLDYVLPPAYQSGINQLLGPSAPAGWQNPNWPLLGPYEAPYQPGW